MSKLLILCFALIMSSLYAQDVAFTIPEKDLIPEGIAHDLVKGKLYVSSTYKRKIVEIDMATGRCSDFIREAQDEIPGVIGMRIDPKRRHLWACAATAGEGMPVRGLEAATDKTGLYQYDLETKSLINKYELEPDTLFHFINDVVVADDGTVYATDTGAGRIYSPGKGGKLELFYSFDGLNPNGIDIADNGDLVVAVYGRPHRFVRLDRKTRTITTVSVPTNETVGADGFYFHQSMLIAIQPFNPQRIVAAYKLEDNTTISEVQTFVDPDHKAFSQPTTGVIVGNEFYFIANSQLQLFRRLFREGKGKYSMDELRDVIVLKARLPELKP